LRRELSIRFETLLIRRLALEELEAFTLKRLRPVLGREVAQIVDNVLADRTEATADVLDALRLQYPDHANELERRFLQQSGFRLIVFALWRLVRGGVDRRRFAGRSET